MNWNSMAREALRHRRKAQRKPADAALKAGAASEQPTTAGAPWEPQNAAAIYQARSRAREITGSS